jgi:hypothetical protein
LTEVITEVTGSERSGLDTRGAAEMRCNAPMDIAMEMTTAVTTVAAETAAKNTLDPMERNTNGKWRRRSEDPAAAWALRDWRSRMQPAAPQLPPELAQLQRTIA